MGYVTPEQITQAKEIDLLTYLQQYAPTSLSMSAAAPIVPVSMTV